MQAQKDRIDCRVQAKDGIKDKERADEEIRSLVLPPPMPQPGEGRITWKICPLTLYLGGG
jgi:hypothetical protein